MASTDYENLKNLTKLVLACSSEATLLRQARLCQIFQIFVIRGGHSTCTPSILNYAVMYQNIFS